MPNYDSAGVFIEERSSGEKVISSVNPSVLGIAGFSLRGVSDNPISFDSYDEFERRCGGFIKSGEAAYQVKAFFDNGGGRGWFSRAIKSADAVKAVHQVSTTLATAGTVTGSKDHAGGIVVITGAAKNIKLTIDTIYIADDLNVCAGGAAGNYAIQTICDNINNALVALFGSAFRNVATVVAGSTPGTYAIAITSPTTGTGSNVDVATATNNDGLADIFGAADDDTGSAASGNTFKVRAKWYGEDGNNISFQIVPSPNDPNSPDPLHGHIFDLTIFYNGSAIEFYEAISFHYSDKDLSIYYKTVLENSSQWVEIVEETVLSGLLVPANGIVYVATPTPHWTAQSLATGHEAISNGDTVRDDDKATALINALQNFNGVEEILNLICPDAENLAASNCASVQIAFANYYTDTERAKDTFAILGTPISLDSAPDMTSVTAYLKTTLAFSHSYGAIYYPPVKIFDLLRRKDRRVSVSGLVAGIYARTDSNKNVGKAPGGTEDGALANISSVYRVLTKGQRDVLYQGRVNPIISSSDTGRCVWGVRTFSLDSEWRYINARRLFIFCERSVYKAIQFAVFENNGPRLWLILRTTIGSFLQGLFVDGYFAGANENEAYYVTCDDTNNPTSQINQGFVTVDVGIAVNKPAEFCRIRFAQRTKGN